MTQVIVLNGGSSSGKSGIARCLQTGARIIVDEVFLGGAASQRRWARALDGLEVLWVGVRCDGAVAAVRESARGDRVTGMAASQAQVVHQGVVYDLEVDTTHTEAVECARAIAARVELPIPQGAGALGRRRRPSASRPRHRIDSSAGVFAGQCFQQLSAGSGQSRPQNFSRPETGQQTAELTMGVGWHTRTVGVARLRRPK